MIKKLLFLLATIGLIVHISGCTSKKSQDDTDIVENAAVDKIDAESQALDATATSDLTAPTEDPSLQAALGESSTPPPDLATQTTDPAATTENLSLDGDASAAASTTDTTATTSSEISAAPTLDESSLNDIPPPTDASVAAMADSSLTSEPPQVVAEEKVEAIPEVQAEAKPESTESALSAPSSSSSSLSDSSYSSPKPAGSTLKKVAETTPYQAGAGWVNTVYVARPGEKLKDISQKIFGADKSKDLKKITENSYLKARSVKAGDKIYYVSPNRPEDSTKMLLYYEDMGMVPETYVAKKGDKLKKVSKEILGYDKAWIEMWTSNPVESKDKLAEGDTLKYWRSTSSISSSEQLAQNTPPPAENNSAQLVDQSQMPASTPPPPQPEIPPADASSQAMAQNTPPPAEMPPPDMNSLPPPPPAEMPPPPPADPALAAAANSAPPPPEANIPPPPPPPDMQAMDKPKKKFSPGAEEESSAMMGDLDQDTMMSLGAVGIFTVALAVVLIRRRKKRASDQAMTEHNVS